MNKYYFGLPLTRILAIVYFSAMAPVVVLTAPVVASQYGMQLHLGPERIGQLISSEFFCMSLATLPAYLWQTRVDWRRVALWAAVGFIVFNIASIFASSFYVLVILRALSALMGGTLMIICMSTAIDSSQPDRIYGLWVVGQLILGALGLWILPLLFADFGLKSLFIALAVLMLVGLPLTRSFPASSNKPLSEQHSGVVSSTRITLVISGLVAILLFYASLGSVWTFMQTIASASHIDGTSSSRVLSIATILGIVGAACATLIGSKWSRSILMIVGSGLMFLSICLLTGTPELLRFTVSTFIFKYSWTFVLPFILACLSDLDKSGRVMNSVNIVIGGGLAIGPIVAGSALENGLGMSTVLAVGAVLVLVSLVMLLIIERVKSRE